MRKKFKKIVPLKKKYINNEFVYKIVIQFGLDFAFVNSKRNLHA